MDANSTTSTATSRVRFFFNDTPPTEIYTLSLHDALPILTTDHERPSLRHPPTGEEPRLYRRGRDRKSTRLNSSHTVISYAVFCLKKKNVRPNAPHFALHHVAQRTVRVANEDMLPVEPLTD